MRIEFKIKEMRIKKKISLTKLSELSGISRTHINDIENNQKMPSLFCIIKLANALGIKNQDSSLLYKIYW